MVREIVVWPSSVLTTPSKEIESIDAEVKALVGDLFDTMYGTENGIGLAAPQIGVNRRVAVINLSKGRDPTQALVLINPVIEKREGESHDEEGCLSIPGEGEAVRRAAKVWMRALDVDGKEYSLETDGLLAVAIQHEVDHLDGKLYVDHISALKRDLIRKRMKKLKSGRAERARR